MSRSVNYDRFPVVSVPVTDISCWSDWTAIGEELRHALSIVSGHLKVVAVECYSGVDEATIARELGREISASYILRTEAIFKIEEQIDTLVAPYLGGDDPIFGRIAPLDLRDFLDDSKLSEYRSTVASFSETVLIVGPGASLIYPPDLLIYADMPRWEGQIRQRRGEVSNLGVQNRGLKASLQYKRSYFVDWRVLDAYKRETMPCWDYLFDTTGEANLVTAAALRVGLDHASSQPFRVVPFFDPAPWGGQWLKAVCGLDPEPDNYGWCFDCVPEENSLLLSYGNTTIEIPSVNLLYHRPIQLLGEPVFGLFGAEFPIRFDFLDTIGGGNLSLQVHPLVEYARAQFGIFYTQDESYYMLEAEPNATVYLGMKTGADPEEMFESLERAQAGEGDFAAERFVNRWPAKKHDHFLIPAGTIHCSGAGSMVLEISATPYIFTFKLWDWNRLGLDGLPRPINIARGRPNLQTDRNTEWTKANLINRVELVAQGPGWREERTGLYALEFIETRRHWFTTMVEHDTNGGVNVLNLVEGDEAIVESPTGAFEPFVVHYAETFIVPACVGRYNIRPHGSFEACECATLKAYVRLGLTHSGVE